MLAALYWQYSQALPWVVGLLIIAGLLLMWLYPPQLRHLPPTWRWAMPVLRLIAVGVIAVSILRPVVSRPRAGAERGPVLWLIDHSRSMGVVDSGRPTGQWVAIAAAMGRLPSQPRDANTQAVQADCDRLSSLADDVTRARAELDYANLSGRSVDAAQSRLDQSITDLQSTAQSAISKTAILVRRGALEKTLAYLVNVPVGTDQQAWLDRIRDKARAAATEAEEVRVANDALLYESDESVRATCSLLKAMSRVDIAQSAILDADHGLVSRVGSDVPSVIFGIGDRVTPISESSVTTTSPVLDADGNSSNLTGGIRSALSSAGDIPARAVVLFSDGRQVDAEVNSPQTMGVPIFTVAAAGRTGLKDVSIVEVSIPSSAFVGEAITVQAQIRGTGFNGQSSDVTLSDGQNQQTRTVKFVDDRPIPVEFKWVPVAGGAVHLEIDADELPGEASSENNQVTRWIKVFDRKDRIAFGGGSVSQDMQIARESLAQSAWATATDFGSLSPDKINQLDVLVLNDVKPDSFDAVHWDAITRLVNEHGGTVVLIPGESGTFGDGTGALKKLLPFQRPTTTNWRTWPGERPGFHIGPAPGVHALEGDEIGDSFWESLPPISRYLPFAPLRPSARALLVETSSGTPLLTEARVGRGRAICFGSNETWRWKSGNIEAQKFWRQLLRYAAGDAYQEQDGALSLDADTIATTPGKPIRIRARITEAAQDPTSIRIRLMLNGALMSEKLLTPIDPKGSGIFETTLTDLREGDYQVEADAGADHPRITLHVHPSIEAEMTDLSGDEGWLRRLADSSGGQFFRLDQMDLLADRLKNLPVDPSHPVELSLWDGPYLYLIVVGCLATEWGLRKRFGLA